MCLSVSGRYNTPVIFCFASFLLLLLFPHFRHIYYPVGMLQLQHFIIMITVATQLRILQQMRRRLIDSRFHIFTMVTQAIETCLKTNAPIDREKSSQQIIINKYFKMQFQGELYGSAFPSISSNWMPSRQRISTPPIQQQKQK